ncbi:MAG: protein phosphatase 2C domain-containing protein [Pseudomonadota bacterium]
MRYTSRTHIGAVRKLNEDAIIARPEIGVFAVADGMGGHAAGDVAAQIVVEMLAMIPVGLGPSELLQAVRGAIHEAHDEIRQESERRGGVTIGATVVALILIDGHYVCLWAGDSRCYQLRDGELEMISADHSLVGELVKDGKLSWDEAEHHPQANTITRAVGVGDALEIDKKMGESLAGDRFMICSDGLTRYAGSMEIESYLRHRPIETVADTLLEIALDGGGADNISVIVVEV